MKRYSEYKDSGVKWIGEIPGHWKMPRLKMLTSFHNGDRSVNYPSGDDFVDDGIPFCGADSLCGLYVDLNYARFITDKKYKLLGGFKIRKNDILYTLRGSTIGKNAMALFSEGTVASSLMGIRKTTNRLISNYLLYTLNSICEENQRNVLINGSTAPNLSAEDVGIFFIPLPPLPEQETIVTYLDTKVAKIDEYISIAEKKIAALEELKQTIIAEAVTRGIHKEVPMKDSGVKWIGMIPEHWKVLCLKYLSKIKGRIGYRGYTAADLVSEGEGAFVIGGKHINQCILNTESPDYISWDKYYESPEIMVSKGDIVMAQRGSLGKVALIDKEINEATINPSLVLIKDICCDASFLYFYLRSNSTLTLIELLNTATAVPMISQKQIEKMPIPLPPLPEQQEIVTYIEAKVAKIDQLCQAERSQIEKLKEYKQRLISDVVTGKVKVTND